MSRQRMRASRGLRGAPLLLAIGACAGGPEMPAAPATSSEVESPLRIEVVSVVAATAPPASTSAHATGEVEVEVEPVNSPQAGPCNLPAVRPSSFGVKQLQHVMPHGRPDSWAGGELATKRNVCPRDAKAPIVAGCTTIGEAEMDAVYRALQAGGFCSLRHESPPRRGSPHYGSRSITIYIGETSFEVSDSSADLLDPASNKRFYEIADAIVQAGLAASRP